MVITSISLSIDNPYSQTIQTFSLKSASLSLQCNKKLHLPFISMSVDNPYAKTVGEFSLQQASMSLTTTPIRPCNYLSLSLTSRNAFTQIVDLIKGITIAMR